MIGLNWKRDQWAVWSSLAFLGLLAIQLLGVYYLAGAQRFEISATHISVALLPVLLWMISSGKVKEFKGPGGLSLVIREEAERAVSPEYDQPLEFAIEHPYEKGGENALQQMLDADPSALSFRLGRSGYYASGAIERYVNVLSRSPRFRYVVFLGQEDRFRGIMPAASFQKTFFEGGNERNDQPDVVEMIESEKILTLPGVVQASVEAGTTNGKALERMAEEGVAMLAVVDTGERFQGVVCQDSIVRNTLATMLRQA